MDVEAVFFDAGSTLIYPEPSVGEVYARALRRAGIEADGPQVQRRFEEAWRRLRRQRAAGALEYGSTEPEAMAWWRRVVRESFAPFGRPDGFEELFLSLWDHFAAAEAWRIYDDVAPTFDALERRGKHIGLISNWDVRLGPLLEQLGLMSRLRWAIISCQVGVEKPEPAIFRRALEACSLPPAKVLHVGDSYREDALGARRAGLRAVLLRRSTDDAPVPDDVTVIASLTELLDLLD